MARSSNKNSGPPGDKNPGGPGRPGNKNPGRPGDKNAGRPGSSRDRLREQQQQAAARDQRMKIIFRSLIGVAVLAVVAVIAAIALNQDGGVEATPTTVTDDGGIVLEPAGSDAGGSDDAAATADGAATNVSVYLDFQCPHCLSFEQTNMPDLTDRLQDGTISLTLHPVALMDNSSQGTDFSSRAANAAVCVAEHQPGALLDVVPALFDLQGAATQGTVNDDVLTSAVSDAGADSSEVRSCMIDREYDGWVRSATDAALNNPSLAGANGGFGTPTVLVDGEVFTGNYEDPTKLPAFIQEKQG